MAKLIKRKDVWTVRYFVPKPLQAVAGRAEIWRSTGTGILRDAEMKQHAIIVGIQKELEETARTASAGPRSTEWVRMVTEEIRKKVDAGTANTDDAQELLSTLIERHLEARGLDPNTVQPDDMAPAHLEAIRAARRLKPSAGSLSLRSAIDKCLEEKAKHVNGSTIGRQRTVLEAFDKWAGHPDLAEIRRREASDYMRDVLLKSGMTAKTQTWHLSALASLFSWAILHDYYTDANPWAGLSASIRESSRGMKKERRRPWSADELTKLDKLADDEPIKQVALLCLYTGMRTDEACSLKIADVHLAEKYIEVVAGKSHDAVRKVPINRRLLPLVKRLHGAATDAGKDHLIADLVPGGKDKKRSHNLSKRAGRWIREHVTKDENLVLYNVRHTFATALENAGIAPSVITRLLGQTQKGLALSTYSGGLDLPALRKAVDKLPTTWPTAG